MEKTTTNKPQHKRHSWNQCQNDVCGHIKPSLLPMLLVLSVKSLQRNEKEDNIFQCNDWMSWPGLLWADFLSRVILHDATPCTHTVSSYNASQFTLWKLTWLLVLKGCSPKYKFDLLVFAFAARKPSVSANSPHLDSSWLYGSGKKWEKRERERERERKRRLVERNRK